MQKIVSIVGPTAVGKTSLAFLLAQKHNGVLVSADSVQVFRNLNIISGKDIPSEVSYEYLPQLSKDGYDSGFYTYHNVPIFLLDVVEPTSSFSVSQFQELADKTIDFIFKKNKLPIVVGGTGLYVNAILNGIDSDSVMPDLKLREELATLNVLKLQKKLESLDKEKLASMNDSDVKNKRRLIRAIEIAKTKSDDRRIVNSNKYESLVIGLFCNKELLKQKIDERVYERLKQGALEEARNLFVNYETLSPQVKDANGYKQLFQYLQNQLSWDEAIYRWKISEYHHAKNQMTWFRKYGNVEWFDIEDKNFRDVIENRIIDFLSSKAE